MISSPSRNHLIWFIDQQISLRFNVTHLNPWLNPNTVCTQITLHLSIEEIVKHGPLLPCHKDECVSVMLFVLPTRIIHISFLQCYASVYIFPTLSFSSSAAAGNSLRSSQRTFIVCSIWGLNWNMSRILSCGQIERPLKQESQTRTPSCESKMAAPIINCISSFCIDCFLSRRSFVPFQ